MNPISLIGIPIRKASATTNAMITKVVPRSCELAKIKPAGNIP